MDSPQTDPETKIQLRVVCLGGDSRKHQSRDVEMRQGREGSQKDVLPSVLSQVSDMLIMFYLTQHIQNIGISVYRL